MPTIQPTCDLCGGLFEGEDNLGPDDDVTCVGCGYTLKYKVLLDQFANRVETALTEDIERMFKEARRPDR